MASTHRAAAAPAGIGLATGASGRPVLQLSIVLITILASTWPDLDHPRFNSTLHPGAALVRLSARIGYAIRTANDKKRQDLHRGPSHSVEWSVLVGLVASGLALLLPPLTPVALWLGAAVSVGCVSHVVMDALTPAGVPLSAVWNTVVHREVWRRHTLSVVRVDSEAEHLIVRPLVYVVTGIVILGAVGWLDDALRIMVGSGG